MAKSNFDEVDATKLHKGGVEITGTAAQLNNVTGAYGTVAPDRAVKVGVKAITGAALHAGVLAWQNPEAVAIIVLREWLDITTQSTGASTIDSGVTPTSATTSSDTLLDGVSGAAVAVFDSMNAALDSGANAKAQKLAAGKWVTIAEASGDVTGLVANLYIEYCLV